MSGFARINYFFAYDNGRKNYMLANLDAIGIATVTFGSGHSIQEAAHGKGRRPARGHDTPPPATAPHDAGRAPPPVHNALLRRIVPKGATAIVDIDAIVESVGIVHHGNDEYLVGLDGFFFHNLYVTLSRL